MAQTQQPVTGNMPATSKHPGGGAGKTMPVRKPEPVSEKYTKPSPGEKGEVDAAKVAALKAKPNRPKPLQRKSVIKLDKEKRKELRKKRKEAAEKFKERSVERTKGRTYMRNFMKRSRKRAANERKKLSRPAKEFKNMSLMYSVGGFPKYQEESKKFREFRKFNASKLSCAKNSPPLVQYMFKVGKVPSS